MISPPDVFLEIPCLTEKSARLGGAAVAKKWFKGADARNLVHYLQKFITYNSDLFRFLGVEPTIFGTDINASLIFRTSNFVGTIPLRSPSTGKQIGDFVVAPRFVGRNRFEDYVEILDLLGSEISPQFADSLALVSGKIFRPPMYLEAVKFIGFLERLLKKPWRKFDSVHEFTSEPVGQIDWDRYANSEYRVEKRLLFPTKRSVLSEMHNEFAEIRYVFDICRKELLSNRTPQRIRTSFRRRLSFIEEKLYFHKPRPTSKINVRAADTPTIRTCKEQANQILDRNFADGTAWRIDFNDVFEKFVQHIFSEVGKAVGGRVFPNLRIPSRTGHRYAWELRHIEPDVVFLREKLTVFIDAKYKSNLFNKYDVSELLKEDYRRDLHQVLAYSSFDASRHKTAFLCYPSTAVELKATNFANSQNDSTTTIYLAGIPLNRGIVPDAVRHIAQKLTSVQLD